MIHPKMQFVKTGNIKTALREERELGEMEPAVQSSWLGEPVSLRLGA